MTISYDGTRFVGWQRQADGVSIQGLLEEALSRFEGAPVAVQGAGRTDAGVHALGQVASVRLTCRHASDVLKRGVNACLPPEVRVTAVEDVAPDFHARFSARSKTYRYLLRNAPLASPFDRGYVWHVPERLDRAAMRAAAAALVGTHDFSAFRSAGGGTRDAIRTVSASQIREAAAAPPWVPDDDARTLLMYEVAADGFLRHMVRAIVGTLVEVGQCRRPAESMAALMAGGDRAQAGATAPPQGLFLVRVDYD